MQEKKEDLQSDYFKLNVEYNSLIAQKNELLSKQKRHAQYKTKNRNQDIIAIEGLQEQMLAQTQIKTKLDAELKIVQINSKTLRTELESIKLADESNEEILGIRKRKKQLEAWLSNLNEFSVKLSS